MTLRAPPVPQAVPFGLGPTRPMHFFFRTMFVCLVWTHGGLCCCIAHLIHLVFFPLRSARWLPKFFYPKNILSIGYSRLLIERPGELFPAPNARFQTFGF